MPPPGRYIPTADLVEIYRDLYGWGRMDADTITECALWMYLGRAGETLGVINLVSDTPPPQLLLINSMFAPCQFARTISMFVCTLYPYYQYVFAVSCTQNINVGL